jgi:hypothetical protein
VVPLLFFSYAPRLNEQTAVNRFVGNSAHHHHENESSATQKPVRVTRPGSVYSQRGYATCGRRQAGTSFRWCCVDRLIPPDVSGVEGWSHASELDFNGRADYCTVRV